MKIFSPALLAFLLLPVSVAQAAVTIVSGNIYDVGKYSFSQDESLYKTYFEGGDPIYNGPTDSATCWAAGSANIIQCWQDVYATSTNMSSAYGQTAANGLNAGYDDPKGTGYLNVYDYILNNWTHGSGYPVNVITWWMQGKTSGANGVYNSSGSYPNATSYGSFYTEIFGATRPTYGDESMKNAAFYSAQVAEYPTNVEARPSYDGIVKTLEDAFKNDGQAVTLNVMPDGGGSGHVITCWGYETDAKGNIISLILSDSDDKKFGTFMVSLLNKDGVAYLQTDARNSWYHTGAYSVADAVYINTPTPTAKTKTDRAVISSIADGVTASGEITGPVSATTPVTIGGGTYSGSSAPASIVVTSKEGAEGGKITITNSASVSTPMLTIEDGAMLLLYNDLTVKNQSGAQTSRGGVLAKGHLYLHGGNVEVSGFTSSDSGGGIYASGVLKLSTKYDDFSQAAASDARAYVEIKGAGDVNISSNTAATFKSYAVEESEQRLIALAGGGAIASEDSLVIADSGKVSLNDNTATGVNVYGGAAYAYFNAYVDGNSSVEIKRNTLSGTGFETYGGGITGSYVEVNGNGDVTFSGNKVSLENKSTYMQDPRNSSSFRGGATAGGGALAAKAFDYITSGSSQDLQSLAPVSTRLEVNGNNKVLFENNSVSASYAGNGKWSQLTEDCRAQGGALYLDSYVPVASVGSAPLITKGSVSENKGDVIFRNNTVTAESTELKNAEAQGGAVYVAESSELKVQNNEGTVSFEGNKATGDVAQGGAIYNGKNATLSISGNKQNVLFSGNNAAEGNDLYNAEGAKAEIAWNGHVELQNSAETKEQDSVVNKGTLYLAAAQGKSIDFVNAKLNSDAGTVVIGADMAGEKGSGTVKFKDSSDSEEAMSVSAKEGMSVTLEKVSIDLNGMVGASSASHPAVENMVLTSSRNVTLSNLTLAANNVVTMTGQHQLTLSDVVIDLSKAQYTRQETGNRVFYHFDLQSLLGGVVSLDNVVFDASAVEGLGVGVAYGMDFGSDVSFNGDAVTTLQLSGAAPTQVTLKSGMVVFGDASVVPEPATTTLSLLALAGLCFRRRRAC